MALTSFIFLCLLGVSSAISFSNEASFINFSAENDTYLDIPYSKELSCGACVLGGYTFAHRGANDWTCCNQTNIGLCNNLPQSSNSGKYKNVFQMLYSFCDNSAVRPRACGVPKTYQVNINANETLDVTNFVLSDSCTFKVASNCSYPVFTVNSTDVNIIVASFKGNDSSSDDFSGKMKQGSKKQGQTVATVDDNMKNGDCVETRMYLTLTRVQPPSPVDPTPQEKSASIRVLQNSDPVSLKITMTAQNNLPILRILGLSLLAALFSVLI